jgi:hypothetical protein
MSVRFKRICKEKELGEVYAPNPGTYFVVSEVIGMFSGMSTVIGHVVIHDGRPMRWWIR